MRPGCAQQPNPQETRNALLNVPLHPLASEFFVNPFNGSDWNNGTKAFPWETISYDRAASRLRLSPAVNLPSCMHLTTALCIMPQAQPWQRRHALPPPHPQTLQPYNPTAQPQSLKLRP